MMNILLDNDVVLDLMLAREPFVIEAAKIWLAHERGHCAIYLAPITPVNVFYVVRRIEGMARAREVVRELLTTLNIAPLNQEDVRLAETFPMSDFEDAVQVAAALAADCQAIVIRNGGDYKDAPIQILSPKAFIARLPKA